MSELPDYVYALNRLIRAASDRLDELIRLMEQKPSISLARAVEAQERKLATLEKQHPDFADSPWVAKVLGTHR